MVKKSTTGLLLVGSPGKALDIRYATGFDAPDPVIVLKSGKKGHLAVPPMELARARRTARGWRVWSWDELRRDAGTPYRIRELTRELVRRAGLRRVIVPMDFPVGVADALRESRVRVDVSEQRLFPERETKSREEVGWIRDAQRAAAAGMSRAVAVITASRVDGAGGLRWRGGPLTSERLRAEIHQVLLARGCAGFETIAACGPASADPHERGHGLLRAGQPIVLDIFPRSLAHGYWGDMTRTVVKGEPPARLRGMYEAVRSAHRAALGAVRARVRCATVHRAACAVFERLGYRTETSGKRPRGFIHSTGHGVGLEVHEAPSVSARPGRLKTGQVITIEPGLYDPEVGGVRIEDTVEVTDRAWRWIWPFRDVFRIP